MPSTAPDKVCLAAVDLARDAAFEVAPPGAVGDWVTAFADGDRVVTHQFACLSPAYVGWQWNVTLARPSRGRTATVDEVVLLPSDGALLAPEWLPWSERLSPGDLGVGHLLPTAPDDPRLVPGFTGLDAIDPDDEPAGDAPLRPAQWEIGLGRVRILSGLGVDDAAMRWHDGDFGPASPMAKAAPASCVSCGFLVAVGGALGLGFGLCANEMSPADGRVVDLEYGCGAHSETPGPIFGIEVATGAVDEIGFDLLEGSPAEHPVFVVIADEVFLDEVPGNEVSLGEVPPDEVPPDETPLDEVPLD